MLPFSIQITVQVVLGWGGKKSEINPCKNDTYWSTIQATGIDIFNICGSPRSEDKGYLRVIKGGKSLNLLATCQQIGKKILCVRGRRLRNTRLVLVFRAWQKKSVNWIHNCTVRLGDPRHLFTCAICLRKRLLSSLLHKVWYGLVLPSVEHCIGL